VGHHLAGGTAAAAARWPDRTALVDDAGSLTWLELHRQSNVLARALLDAGLAPGQPIAVMCRNHRWMVTTTVAAAKLGLTAIYLNTRFAGPQAADVCAREEVAAIIHDAEFAEVLALVDCPHRYVAWPDGGRRDREGSTPHLADLVASGDPRSLPAPREPGRIVILTSGTTGRPKGAQRHQPSSVDPIASLFDRIPFRAGETVLLAAPLFHSWGMLNFGFGLSLGSRYILQRQFDPERVLAAVERHRCTALVVVPVMLQRIMQLPPEVLGRHDVSSLRIIAASGSALPGDLALAVLDHFGDVLYNFYGSTEVSWVTIAGPADCGPLPALPGGHLAARP
jgi:fatty-acyl-CoA synthase